MKIGHQPAADSGFHQHRLNVHDDVDDAQAAAETEQRQAQPPDRIGQRHAGQRQGQQRDTAQLHRANAPAGHQDAGNGHPGQRADPNAQQQQTEHRIGHLDAFTDVRHQRRPDGKAEAGHEETATGRVAHDGGINLNGVTNREHGRRTSISRKWMCRKRRDWAPSPHGQQSGIEEKQQPTSCGQADRAGT